MLSQDLYVNGKPLLPPPQSIQEELEERLNKNQIELEEIFKLQQQRELQIIDIDGLASYWFDKDKTFQTLLGNIKSWNEQVMDLKKKRISEIPNSLVMDSVHRILAKYLMEIITTKTKNVAKQQLEKIRSWYHKQTSFGNPNDTQLVNQQTSRRNRSDIKSQTAFYKEQALKDFQNQYRSIHSNIDHPEERLKEFQRRTLVSQVSTTVSRPGTSNDLKRQDGETGSRPESSQYRMIEKVETSMRPRTNEQKKIQDVQPASTWFYNQQFPIFKSYEEKVTEVKKQVKPTSQPEIIPEQASAIKEDEQSKSIFQVEDKVEDEEEEPQISKRQAITISPDRKLFRDDKLNSNQYNKTNSNQYLGEAKSSYLHYNPMKQKESENIGIKIQNLYHENINRVLKDQQEDQEVIKLLQSWANNKGRMDEIITQRDETLLQSSRFSSMGIKMSNIFKKDQKFILKGGSKSITQLTNKVKTSEDDKKGKSNDSFDDEKAYQKYLQMTKPKEQNENIGLSKSPSQKGYSTTKVDGKIIDFTNKTPVQLGDRIFDPQDKVLDLEHKIKMDKLNKLKKMRGSQIPGGLSSCDLDSDEIERRKQLSNSMYGNKRLIKDTGNRPFSGVFKVINQEQVIKEQVKEIETIKVFLAKKNITLSALTLQKSLLIPYTNEEYKKVPLPQPSFGISDLPEEFKQTTGNKSKFRKTSSTTKTKKLKNRK